MNAGGAFGQPLYNNLTSSGSSSARGGSFGSTASNSRTSNGSTGSSGGLSGGSASLSGGSGSRTGGTTATAPFAGASFGPSIGVRGATISSTLKFKNAPVAPTARRDDLRQILMRSSSLSAPAGLTVEMKDGVVILKGSVANEDEKRLAENMLRLSPGVRDIQNDIAIKGS